MSLPSVTPAQYRALEAVEAGHLAVTDEGKWLYATHSTERRARRDVLGRIWEAGFIRRGARFEHFKGVCHAVLTARGRRVLATKRGEGHRG